MSAEYECGQILFNLKNSNLHYLIEETHKSAYITVRKKLINEVINAPREVIGVNAVYNSRSIDDKIRMENGLLKQEINDLKQKIANIELERDEVDIKNESINGTIDTLEDKLEVAYSESRKLKGLLNDKKVKIDDMDEKIEQSYVEISDLHAIVAKLKISKDKLEKNQNQSEEHILMLENVVETERGKVKELEKDI